MATLDGVTEIIVRTDGAPVGRQGFSRAIIVDDAGMTERVQYFASPAEASSAFDAGDITAAQLAHIQAGFSAKQRPAQIGAARAAAEVAQVNTVTIGGTIANGENFTITLNGTPFAVVAVVPTDDASAIATKLAAAVNGGSEPVTASPAAAVVTLTADDPGEAFTLAVSTDSAAGTIVAASVTANLSIADELAAILAADLVGWYGFQTVSRSAGTIKRAAAWAETNQRFHAPQTSDADVKTSSTTDVMSVLKAAGYEYTKCAWFSDDSVPMMFELLCDRLAVNPDTQTTIWDYVTLPGITPDTANISTTELNNITSKNGTVYLTLGGVGSSGGGNKQASGRFSDVQITVDWLRARLDEAHARFLLAASNRGSKVPYTDAGFAQLRGVVQSVYQIGITAGHFEPATDDDGNTISPYITIPRRADLSEADVALRKLPYTSGALLAGGVQQVKHTADLTDNLDTLALLAGV